MVEELIKIIETKKIVMSNLEKIRDIINWSDVFIIRVDIFGSDKCITFTQKD